MISLRIHNLSWVNTYSLKYTALEVLSPKVHFKLYRLSWFSLSVLGASCSGKIVLKEQHKAYGRSRWSTDTHFSQGKILPTTTLYQLIIKKKMRSQKSEQELGHLAGIYFSIGQLTSPGLGMPSVPGGWPGMNWRRTNIPHLPNVTQVRCISYSFRNFYVMVLGELDSYLQKNETEPLSQTIPKNKMN